MRVLCRRGFPETAPDQPDAVRHYRRTATWPPPAAYLSSGAIGFAYYLQMWFRYYLQQHIESAMSELEVHEGTYSLDFHHHVEDRGDDGHSANPLGSPVDRDGKWWASQGNASGAAKSGFGGCDLSQMTLEWVAHTEDPISSDLSRQDRYLLYLVFVRNYKWAQIADALQLSMPGMTPKELEAAATAARRQMAAVLDTVRTFVTLTADADYRWSKEKPHDQPRGSGARREFATARHYYEEY